MHERDAGVEEGRVDELATARAVALLERHQHADRGEQAGADVDERDAGLVGPHSGLPLTLNQPVIAWMTAS